MKPIVSIIMGSTSDLPVMEKAAAFLNDMKVPFEMNALSAHRTPEAVESFAKGAAERGRELRRVRSRPRQKERSSAPNRHGWLRGRRRRRS